MMYRGGLILCFSTATVFSIPRPIVTNPGSVHGLQSKVNPDEAGRFLEGDLLVGSQSPHPRNGILDETYRWPNGVVPYRFSNKYNYENKSVVITAMADIEKQTDGCISFLEQTDQVDFVFFTQIEAGGCYSLVGRQGGPQVINYSQWGFKVYGTLLHEMLHTLGFFHEHNRFDRDQFVQIQWHNIKKDMEDNFQKYSRQHIGGFGEEYDYGSVMHYSAYAFSNNGEKTIIAQNSSVDLGQRKNLSDVDLRKLKRMYNCPSN